MKREQQNSDIIEYVIDLVKNEKPQSVKQLVKLVQQKYPLKENDIMNILVQLENEGKLHFVAKETLASTSLIQYIFLSKPYWYWTAVTFTIITTVAAFTISEDAYPFVYLRYVLGTVFVLWLPGYTLMKAVFPSKKELDNVEQVALSLGLSLAIVPVVGLLLNFTPWGIRQTPIILSLSGVTIIFATIGVVHEHYMKMKEAKIVLERQN